MFYIILALLLFSLFFLPQWWVKHIMKRYSKIIDSLPGTGGQLAQHFITHYQLPVSLEETEQGDHYDPESKTVRLSKENLNGKSLTAIAIATHEVGHAIQDHKNDQLLLLRGKMVNASQRLQKFGAAIMFIAPFATLFSRSPVVGLIIVLLGFFSLASSVVVQLINLPVEFDASFNKALPLLKEGHYIPKQDLIAVRQILLAAALTYVASALAGLLNVGRWLVLLKR